MRLLIRVLLSSFLAAACSLGQGNIAARSGYREVAERLTNFIRHEMADKGLPALSIVLVDDKKRFGPRGSATPIRRTTFRLPREPSHQHSIFGWFISIRRSSQYAHHPRAPYLEHHEAL